MVKTPKSQKTPLHAMVNAPKSQKTPLHMMVNAVLSLKTPLHAMVNYQKPFFYSDDVTCFRPVIGSAAKQSDSEEIASFFCGTHTRFI